MRVMDLVSLLYFSVHDMFMNNSNIQILQPPAALRLVALRLVLGQANQKVSRRVMDPVSF